MLPALLTLAMAAASAPGGDVRIVAGPPAAPAEPAASPVEIPDLGVVRYRNPAVARRLWLGLDVGGVVIPKSLGLFRDTVWAQRTSGAWTLALTPWLAAGGRHDTVFYDARNIRLQVIEHRLSVSARPLYGRRSERLRDRLEFGIEHHNIKRSWLDGVLFKFGGLWDTVLFAGYGFDHRLHPRWLLGWNVQGRYAWVFLDSQRMARASIRPTFFPRPNHALSLEALGFLIHRDEDQAGNPLPRVSGAAQANLDWTWMSKKQVGTFVRLHYASSFLSGEAPVYEIREEAINNQFGELSVGLRAYY